MSYDSPVELESALKPCDSHGNWEGGGGGAGGGRGGAAAALRVLSCLHMNKGTSQKNKSTWRKINNQYLEKLNKMYLINIWLPHKVNYS